MNLSLCIRVSYRVRSPLHHYGVFVHALNRRFKIIIPYTIIHNIGLYLYSCLYVYAYTYLYVCIISCLCPHRKDKTKMTNEDRGNNDYHLMILYCGKVFQYARISNDKDGAASNRGELTVSEQNRTQANFSLPPSIWTAIVSWSVCLCLNVVADLIQSRLISLLLSFAY